MSPNKSYSKSRALVFTAAVLGIVTGSISCAHYDNESGTYSGSVWAPLPGNSRNIDVVEGAIAGISIIYEMARVSGNAKSPQIFGVCKVKIARGTASDSGKDRCQETFVQFRSLKDGHESKVWADATGEFTFAMSPGDTYEVVAVNERLRIQSKSLRVSRPGQLNLQIEIETVSAQPVAAQPRAAEASGDKVAEKPSGTPPLDFGLKPRK